MIYFANPTGGALTHMLNGELGFIDTPLQGNRRPAAIPFWCADNGCFNDSRFDVEKWWAWLESHVADIETCVFATAPDVVGDHGATLKRSRPWLPKIRGLGYKAAFVAQDGATIDTTPWQNFDVLFIGAQLNSNSGTQHAN